VRTVGTVSRTATDGPRQQRFPAYRAPLSRVCWRFGDRVGGVPAPGRRVPVPVGNAGLAVIRRTQPVSVPSRAARAASTSASRSSPAWFPGHDVGRLWS